MVIRYGKRIQRKKGSRTLFSRQKKGPGPFFSEIVAGICLAAVLALSGCGARAGEDKTPLPVEKSYELGPLAVRVCLDSNSISIAETVTLQLEAAIEPNYTVSMPRIDAVLKDFGIVDWQGLPDRLDDAERTVKTRRYNLEPFLSGDYQIPALVFEFSDPNDAEKVHELSTEPVEIEVTSLLGEDRSQLVIADIEGVVPMRGASAAVWLWAAAGIAAAAAAGGWLLWRRRRPAGPVRIFRPAHELAYARLRRLVEEDLVGRGLVKEFHDRISDILRYYIEDRFDLRAPERTTEEFLFELHNTDILGDGDKADLGRFLRHCDLVKFAEFCPDREQIQRTFDLVKEFLSRTASDQRRVDVTERAEAAEPAGTGV